MKVQLKQHSARIELIPLIDIIFLLLVFFIYSMLSMVVYRGIPIVLPTADSIEAEKGQVLNITIDEAGNVFLDEELTPNNKLLPRLKSEQSEPFDAGGQRSTPRLVLYLRNKCH